MHTIILDKRGNLYSAHLEDNCQFVFGYSVDEAVKMLLRLFDHIEEYNIKFSSKKLEMALVACSNCSSGMKLEVALEFGGVCDGCWDEFAFFCADEFQTDGA